MAWDYSKLRGLIKEKFGTQNRFAEALGISRTSLSMRLQNEVEFSQNEIARSLDLLGGDEKDMIVLFYTPKVQESEQK